MKKTVQRIVSCLVFAALLIGAVYSCSRLLEQKEARKIYDPFYKSETNFDVIFLGTSHMWDHVLPMEMWRQYGISSYNWGYSNCTPAEDYYIIQDVIKYTNPKVVVVDAYGMVEYNPNRNGKYKDAKIEQQHVQFDSFPIWSLSKYRASKDVFETYEHNEDFIWDFIMYHNRWSELTQDDFDYELNTQKGAYFFTGMGDAVFDQIPEDEKTELNSVCFPYYLKIIEYCQSKGIQVLGVYLPFGAKEQQQRVANTLGEYVEQYPNGRFVNMLTEGILNFDTDVGYDDHHLNYSGASKVTAWLGQYLRDHYQLDDYSNDASWIADYQDYYEYKKSIIEKQTKLPSFLVQLADSDFIGELEIYDENLKNSVRLAELLENADIVPVYAQNDNGACARLIIRSARTNELIRDVYFAGKVTANQDLNKIVWKTGWQKAGETWYYYGEDGLIRTGLLEIDGKSYLFDGNGEMFSFGWRKLDGNWYFFDSEGVMTVGWRQMGGKFYYMREDGTMVSGFQEIDKNRYYFNEDGERVTGWLEYEGNRYWFDASGVMAANTRKTIDGKRYCFDADGVCTNP